MRHIIYLSVIAVLSLLLYLTGSAHWQAVDQCEASLPRDQHCRVVISAEVVKERKL